MVLQLEMNRTILNATNDTIYVLDGQNAPSTKSLELEIFITTIRTIIALLGISGNLAVSIVITLNKNRKSSTELLIRNLALADIGVLLITFPLTVIKEKLPQDWPFGKIFCLYAYPLSDIFYGVSVWSIVAIAVERYRHLVCPLKKDRRHTMKIVKRLIILIWIGCFLVFCVPMVFHIEYIHDSKKTMCYLKPPSVVVASIFQMLFLLGWYIFPVAIISWSYFLISRKLDQSSFFLRNMHASGTPRLSRRSNTQLSLMQERRLSQNRRVKRVLTPVVIAFAILMMPVNVFRLVIAFYPVITDAKIYPFTIYLLSLCVIVNSSINPIIYSFVSPGFRAGIRALFKNRSYKVSFMAGSAIRAVGNRITLRVSHRRSYTFSTREQLEMKSVVRSGQVPIP